MQDIVGCRAVCVNSLGVRAVNREIVAHFGARVPRAPRARRTELGYLSWHAGLEPVPGGPGWRTEIQVRTLTQPAWARTSELLAYKPGDKAEALMALLVDRVLDRDEGGRGGLRFPRHCGHDLPVQTGDATSLSTYRPRNEWQFPGQYARFGIGGRACRLGADRRAQANPRAGQKKGSPQEGKALR
jgi:hypothetical protein